MPQRKIGLIGYGYWGPNLARNFSEMSSAEFVAVADMNRQQLDRVQKRYPSIETTSDYTDLFSMGLDGVAIATPPNTHYAIAKNCLEHGLDVMIEKPITLNTMHAVELIQIAEQNDRILMVGHTMEYNPAMVYIKDLIKKGDLGNILYIDMMRVNLGLFQSRANVIWDLAPHDLSVLMNLLDSEPISVNVDHVNCITPGLADLAYISLRFPENVHAHIQVSWLSPRKIRQLTVVGSQRMVFFDDVEQTEKIKLFDKGVDRTPPPYTETLEQFHWSYHHGDVIIPHLKWSEPLTLQCAEFVNSIDQRRQPLTDGLNGLRVVNILEAIERSLQDGGKDQEITPFTKLASQITAI
jgi:predicted dehydrogenase